MLYGHRKDVEGFAKSLEEFDGLLDPFLQLLAESDLLMITADHGCDPDLRWETTDHSREYVPILAYSPGNGAGVNLGIRETLADMGQTIAENFGGTIPHGASFLREVGQHVRTISAMMDDGRPVAALSERAGFRRSIATCVSAPLRSVISTTNPVHVR